MYYPSNVKKQKSRSKSKTSRTTVSEIYLAKKIHKRYLELLKLFIYFIYLFLLFLGDLVMVGVDFCVFLGKLVGFKRNKRTEILSDLYIA